MNKTFKKIVNISPFISLFFALIGLIMAILSIMEQNVKTFTMCLFLIIQSGLLAIYGKMFRKYEDKSMM